MVVTRESADRLELRGNPAAGFAVMGLLVVPTLMGGCAFFLWRAFQAGKGAWSYDAILLSVVLLAASAMLVFCVSLLFQRESLTIDRIAGRVEHRRWSMLFGREKVKSYPLSRVVGVSLERTTKAAGGGRRGGGWTTVNSTRLLLDKPRRAIVLASSESGWDRQVRPTARVVARFLNTSLTPLGEVEQDEAASLLHAAGD